MKYFAFASHSHVRNAVLCALATLTLAACGEDGSSGTSAATGLVSPAILVAPNAGIIQRLTENTPPSSAGTATSGTQTAAATPTAATTPSTPPSSGNPPSSGSPTTTTPVPGATVASTPTPPAKTTGVATLDWTPPTENSDGSTLTNLAGYTVYYGTSPTNLTQTVKVTNPGLTAYTVTNLSSGTWYFSVASYSSSGVESVRTGTVSSTI